VKSSGLVDHQGKYSIVDTLNEESLFFGIVEAMAYFSTICIKANQDLFLRSSIPSVVLKTNIAADLFFFTINNTEVKR